MFAVQQTANSKQQTRQQIRVQARLVYGWSSTLFLLLFVFRCVSSSMLLKLTRSSFGLGLVSTFMVYKCHQNCNSIRVSKCHTMPYNAIYIFISVVVMSLWHDRLFGGYIEWVFWFAANGQQYCHRPHCPLADRQAMQKLFKFTELTNTN
uniref:Uncharacterized protein n=1 Tax=Glossina brevipalpis TaxID=37001 RepID=A0A1A9WDZ4_9MUSC